MHYKTYIFTLLYIFLCQATTESNNSFEDVMLDGMRTLARILEITEKRHYNITNPQKCFNQSVKAFLNCLDPHSTYLDEKTYRRILEISNGEFFGIGIVIDNTRTEKDKALLVIDVIPEGPAAKAGIQAFDKIVEIDGQPLENKTTDELITLLKGERNTIVSIKVTREDKPDILSFDIKRDIIQEQQSLCFYIKNENIYYLSLSTFADNSVKQLKALLQKSIEHEYKGLILDLRNNVGGTLPVAIDIVGLFLNKNSLVVSIRDKDNNIKEEYRTTQQPIAKSSIPIFILINNYTASAAEILAECLRQHSDATNKLMIFIVGSQSFGKGSVQEVIPLDSNRALKLTTSLYFLPQGNTIQGIGITPDFIIERCLPQPEHLQWFKKTYGREKNLHNHIKVHNEPKHTVNSLDNKQASWIDRSKKILEDDNQVREAITLINLFDFIRQLAPKKIETRQKATAILNSIVSTDRPLEFLEVKT